MARAMFACAVRYSRTLRFWRMASFASSAARCARLASISSGYFGGVYKHEDIVALDLHHALGNGSGAPLLTRCAVREHARHDGGDHIAVTRQNAVLADRCGHDKRLALALEKDLIGSSRCI